MEIAISTSKKPDMQYDARNDNQQTASFGEQDTSYYTKHKDPDRKALCIAGHNKNTMRIGLNRVLKQQGRRVTSY